MPTKKPSRTPSLRRHKASNRAFVELNAHRHYLGPWGAQSTEEAYHRLVGEWVANGRRLPVDPHEITVTELIAAYWRHAQDYYVRADGSPSGEADNLRGAMRPLNRLYGSTRAADFGPLGLKTVRQEMIETGWCRTHINAQSL